MALQLEDIRRAAGLLAGHVVRTPMTEAARLEERLGCQLFLKLETLQRTGSFKVRGAGVRLAGLSPAEARAGVIAMSAGNHAQGVAYHARRLGIPATIVMPEFAPFTKVERTRRYGAEVVLSGETVEAAAEEARRIGAERGLTFVHPYDDAEIMAGQGTIALEMLEDRPELETLVVPIGGGGLCAGIATAAKALKPSIRIIGVQAALFASMPHPHRRAAGLGAEEENGPAGASLADGIAVKTPGRLTRPIIEALVEEILLVDETAIETAVQLLAETQKLVTEGAGAAGVAAILAAPDSFAGQKVGVVLCGGNIDARLLSWVLTRGLVRDGRLARLRIVLDDRPGTLARVASAIGEKGGNIIEVNHQRMFFHVSAKQTEVDVVIETRDRSHVAEIAAHLEANGLPTQVLEGGMLEAGETRA